MKTHQSPVGKTDTWITPKYITDALGAFDLDPCAHTEMPWQHATDEYTVYDDGLARKWIGRVWLNPPFNRFQKHLWMSKMRKHRSGIMMVPAAMETTPWKRYVTEENAWFLVMDHRPHFCLPSGERAKANSGCTIALISYSEYDTEMLFESNLGAMHRNFINRSA